MISEDQLQIEIIIGKLLEINFELNQKCMIMFIVLSNLIIIIND